VEVLESECKEDLELGPGERLSVENYTFLTTVANEIEAGALETLLMENSIPVLKKYPGLGEYLKVYMGMVNIGVQLYVPESCVPLAEKIIAERIAVGRQIDDKTIPESLAPVTEETEGETEGKPTFFVSKKTVLSRIIFLCFILPLLLNLFLSMITRGE